MITNVLVTGANGQLAQTIKELYQKNKDNIKFTFVAKSDLELTNHNQVDKLFNAQVFNYCINCAAYTNVEQAEDSKTLAFNVNAEAVKNLATICKANSTTLIHISTDYVFNGEKKQPYKETDNTNPLNNYGASKLKGEAYIPQFIDSYFIIRTSWLFSKFGKNFYKTISNKIKEQTNLKITTAETGTPTSCVDLANAIYFLIASKNKNYGLYHFSNLGQATWYEFAKEIALVMGHYNLDKIQPVDFFKTKAKRPQFSVLDKSKISTILPQEIPHWKEALNNLFKII